MQAIAEAARREGAHVACGCLELAPSHEAPRDHALVDQGFSALLPRVDEPSIEAFVSAAIERLGGLDVLVTAFSSGAAEADATPFSETTLAAWNARLEGALRLPFLATRRALEELLAGGAGGRIVIVHDRSLGDVGGLAATTALSSLVRSLAREYGRRAITCNAVVAGPAAADGAARATLFFVSEDAAFVNGEMVVVDPS